MQMLKIIRKNVGITQKELSERSGVSFRMIQKYEQGEKSLSKASAITVLRIAEVLKCDVRDLISPEKS